MYQNLKNRSKFENDSNVVCFFFPYSFVKTLLFKGKWSKLFYMLGTPFFEEGRGLGKRPWVSKDKWGVLGKRPWVSKDRWGGGGGWVRDHGLVQTSRVGGGGLCKRPLVSKDRLGWGLGLDKRPWACTDKCGGGGGGHGKRPGVFTD